MKPARAADAARNNAEWCDIVCRTHAGPGEFRAEAWTTPLRSPPYYPDAVTLAPSVQTDQLLSRIDAGAGCSVKDSFAALDLGAGGFRVLFGAEWIGRAAGDPIDAVARGVPRWQPVRDARELVEWEAAWAGTDGPESLFRPALLDHPDVVVLGGRAGEQFVAGAVLHRSVHVVGLSNLFARDQDLDAALTAAIAAAAERFPTAPIVGYESGEELAAARRHGFVALGPLRVWINEGA